MLFVERHRLLLLLLTIVFVPLLHAFEQRRNLLHLDEGFELRGIERPENEADQRRQDDQTPAEVAHRLVDRHDDRREKVDDGIEPRRREKKVHALPRLCARDEVNPARMPGMAAAKRAERPATFRAKLRARAIATSAYCEQLG